MPDQVLSKIVTSGDESEYFVLTTVHDEGESGFDLAVVRDESAWTGSLADTELERAGDKLKMEYDDYVAQTRKALTQQNVGGLQFQYTMKERDGSLVFTWKKHIAEDNIKIQLGSVVLKERRNASEVTKLIFEHALKATTSLQTEISTLQADKERLMAERTSALKRLEKCVAAKEEMEQAMYEKFVIVVNDKKAKIRSLKEQVDGASQASGSRVTQSIGAGEGTSSGPQASTARDAAMAGSETDELSLHDSEYDTEEEKIAPPTKKKKMAKPVVLSEEDSLILDDSPVSTTPIAPRRRRQQQQTKNKTPSRPVIPKGSSRDSTPRSNSRRGSVRRSSSNTSSRSNQSQDPENLIDEM